MPLQTVVAVARDVGAPPAPGRRRHHAALRVRVWDALTRRQRELPAHFLADDDITPVRRQVEQLHAEHLIDRELPLVRQCFAALAATPIRSVIELLPGGTATVLEILGAPSAAPPEAYIALDVAPAPTQDAIVRVRGRMPHLAAARIVTDPTVTLTIPRSLPRPAIFACLGGAIGRFTTIGAIRFLRAIRAAMSSNDRLILGIDLRAGSLLEAEHSRSRALREALHRHALAVVNRDCGADFDLERFRYYARYDGNNKRLDIGLESVAASLVQMPPMRELCLPAASTIRTSVHCSYDRRTIQAMLLGVGLIMDTWHENERGDHAVASVSAVQGDVRG